ncbi:MAG TPA: GNAT family N-acetyltransferase [Bacillota bacterium]
MNYEDKINIESITEVDDYLRDIILAIDEEAFGQGSLNEWSLPPFLHHGKVYLARYNGVPAAIAELLRDWQEPELVYLYGLAVAKEYRGFGVGTALLSFILTNLTQNGFRRLQLTVHPDNQAALHMYQAKFGMTRLRLEKNYYGKGEDRWLMEWRSEL